MSRRARPFVGVAAFSGVLLVGAWLFGGQAKEESSALGDLAWKNAAVRCQGSVVELDFDPGGRIEARIGAETVAEAGVHSQRLNDDACAETPPPGSFSQAGVRYRRRADRTTLTCRFPGRVLVHAESVSPSWAGERPAGRAVALVLERRLSSKPGPPRVILASAVVVERHEESSVVFVRRYCSPSSDRPTSP
jgi:hypothetical protein